MQAKYRNTVEFVVYGDYALFSDPSTRVGGEKMSYQIPTYEALKGVLQSIYWKPTIIWYIDDVRIMNPIQTEVKGIRTLKYSNGKNDLSYYTYLKDCKYQVRAHFEWNLNRPELENDRNENKHHNIAKRMIEKGGRRDVFLGSRECQAYVEPCIFGEGKGFYDEIPSLNFGIMYHGITYPDEAYSDLTQDRVSIRFTDYAMEYGIIHFEKPEKCKHIKYLHKLKMKKFGKEFNNFTNLDEEENV